MLRLTCTLTMSLLCTRTDVCIALPRLQERAPAAAFGGAKSEYTRSQLEASAAAKDDFFARQMAANASKPEGVAPSQARPNHCLP